MLEDGLGIRILDNPFTGKKITSTPKSRQRAKRINAIYMCERAIIMGGHSYYVNAYTAMQEAGMQKWPFTEQEEKRILEEDSRILKTK